MAKQLTHTGAQLDAAIEKVQTSYADVAPTTAQPSEVCAGKVYVGANKLLTEGTMPDVTLNVSEDISSDYLGDTETGYGVIITPKATPTAGGRVAAGTVSGATVRKYIKVETPNITQNGTYAPSQGKLFSGVSVGVYKSGLQGGRNVTFNVNGTDYAFYSVKPGESITEPTPPNIEGYMFNGWFTQSGGQGSQINFPYTPTQNTILYAQLVEKIVVGFIGLSNQTPGLMLTDDIASVGNYSTAQSGDYVNVSNPLDDFFPFSEISEFTDAEGNIFVKYPKMWMKWVLTQDGIVDGVKFANYNAGDDYFVSDAYFDPAGGASYLQYFALGKYEGSGSADKIYSKSGETCANNISRGDFRTACRSYGNVNNFYNGYQSIDIQQLTIYNLLCMMYYRTQNIQTVYGGRTNNGTIADTGSCDGCAGMNGWNTATNCIKLLGIENPFGNIYKWIDGIVVDSTYPRRIGIFRDPMNFSDNINSSSLLGFTPPGNEGFVSALKPGTYVSTRSVLYCSGADGNASSYIGDKYTPSESNRAFVYGGDYNSGNNAGLWCSYGVDLAGQEYFGGRLAYRPVR